MKFLYSLVFIFILSYCGKVHTSKKVIAIQPIGDFESAMVDTITQTIKIVYAFKEVKILPNIPIPKRAFVQIKSPRYRADTIIKLLKQRKPKSINYVIGLMSKDISTTKRDRWGKVLEPKSKYIDWGIFGLGYVPGPSCVVSSYRVRNGNQNRYRQRMKKVCMHEIGHNLGLKHCSHGKKCLMRDAAETIKTIDQVQLSLCNYCKEKIK